MSPRYPVKPPRDVEPAEAQMREEASRQAALQGSMDPYRLQRRPAERYDVEHEQYVAAEPPAQVPSFWFDLLLEREAAVREQRAFASPLLRGRDPGDPDNLTADAELAAARERLASVRQYDKFELDRLAQRDLTSAGFVPAGGAPMFLAEQFAPAARARAGLAAALPQVHLPDQGDHIEVPRLSGGAQTVRLQARQYAAAMFARQPKAICRISGTGLVAPVL
jgi:hypothetical protein